MEPERRERLETLLKRLGRAVRDAVKDSREVGACLAELQAEGWDAVMLLEASLVCRDGGRPETEADHLHVSIAPREGSAEFRLDAADARWLAAIGISPTRYRSQPTRSLPPFHQALLPPPRDG